VVGRREREPTDLRCPPRTRGVASAGGTGLTLATRSRTREADVADLVLPTDLVPRDGRFGCGPSKVRPEALARLAEVGDDLLGTSHRQPRVKDQVRRLQDGLGALFALPDGYEVLLTVGGATAFWESAAFGLVERRARHYTFGEFSAKFAKATAAAPWLDDPDVVSSAPGTRPDTSPAPGCDVQAFTHNETSTGVMQQPERPDDALVLVDATSGAGGLPVELRDVDVYYFSLQKGFASEGGLTVALLSPAAVDRIRRIADSGRYVPTFLDLATALDNSRKHQTYNTPSVSSVFLAAEQVDWMNERFGGLDGVVDQQRAKAATVYGWAEQREWADPFVHDPAARSLVVATVDLAAEVTADEVNAVLRANGILDTDAYRKLGRNQLRVGMFPAVDAADLEAYTACVDWVVERIAVG
jgi:phosphoserine aminotransferase